MANCLMQKLYGFKGGLLLRNFERVVFVSFNWTVCFYNESKEYQNVKVVKC